MNFADLSSIQVSARQRTKMAPAALSELAASIVKLGLLHPVVLSPLPGGRLSLVAGERRLRAMEKLHSDEVYFSCGDFIVPPNQIPYLLVSDLSDQQLMEAELEENILREELSWQDRVRALDTIHRVRVESNPKQTVIETATELVEKSGDGSIDHTREQIARAQIINQHLDDPEVASARNQTEAWDKIRRKAESTLHAEMARRHDAEQTPHLLIHGDAFEELPQLEAGTFDLILSDPPYGYGADGSTGGWARQVQAGHKYDDSPQAAKEVAECIIREGFRLTKPRANLFLFTHHETFWDLHVYCKQQGWTPWMRPVIWQKSKEGLSPWGHQGFRYSYEFILYATKGEKGLLRPHIDILSVYKITRGKVHGAQKPVELFRLLIDLSTTPGGLVLDPCCGSGTIFPAATAAKCLATGIEKEKEYYDVATNRLGEGVGDDPEGRVGVPIDNP